MGFWEHRQRVSTTFLTRKKPLVLLTGFEPRVFGSGVQRSTNGATPSPSLNPFCTCMSLHIPQVADSSGHPLKQAIATHLYRLFSKNPKPDTRRMFLGKPHLISNRGLILGTETMTGHLPVPPSPRGHQDQGGWHGWGGSIGRALDSRAKDPRFKPRQQRKKELSYSESKMLC